MKISIPIDEDLKRRVDLEAGNLVHDLAGMWCAYASWCQAGEQTPADIWKKGLHILLGSRDQKKARLFVTEGLKRTGFDYKALEKKAK